jgi:hypothetical protein
MFNKVKDAMGAAAEAQKLAEQMAKQGGHQDVTMANAGELAAQGMKERSEIEATAHELNRILSVGSPGKVTIVSHVDTGEKVGVAGYWILNLEVTPEGGAPYTVEKKELVGAVNAASYADGTTMDCRIDPADTSKIAFGDKPFM